MTILVLHGTTLHRAEQIVQYGPDPSYIEPLDSVPSQGFCVSLSDDVYPLGSPEDYARRKSMNFPNEGGPVILEIEIDQDLLQLSMTETHDYQFELGYGMEELLAAWDNIPKRIRRLD